MTTETPPQPAPAPPQAPTPSYREVTLNYRHAHHVPSDAEYPTDEGLHAKAEEYLTPGFWRLYVYRKQKDDEVINVITLSGISEPTDMPSNIDTEELERTILSVCYRDIRKQKVRTHYLIRFKFKTPAGHRQKHRDVTMTLDPLESDNGDYDGSTHEKDEELDRREERLRTGRWADPERSSFQEAYSPFSATSRDRRSSSWRENFLRDLPDQSRPAESDPERRFEEGLATRRAQMFSQDMMMQFNPDRMSAEGQRAYTEATLPYALINSSMGMSYQAFGAAFDMVTAGAREQARLHALQMQVTIDREKELMKLPLKFLEIEASNKGHQSEILHESQRNYLEALRMRGDMAQRELGYERQNMQAQYQITESQRVLTDQEEKHGREQGETFRRDLIRGLGPMALQGIGLFLDYFGQQKLGAAAKMSGSVVEGIMTNIEKQAGQAAPGAQPSPPAPGQAAAPTPMPPQGDPNGSRRAPVVDAEASVPAGRRGPVIPRRNVRILDVATQEEIQMQPLRSLCRMADRSISDDDRARVQQILSEQEWGQLESALRAASDQECMQGLGVAMFSIGQDPARYERMMSAFSAGQRELLNTIGDVMQGKITAVDPNYTVQLRPATTRMRTVVQRAAPTRTPPPVPPPDLDSPVAPTAAPVSPPPVPPPSAGTTDEPATQDAGEGGGDAAEDIPRPTIKADKLEAEAPADPSVAHETAAEMRDLRDELQKLRLESSEQREQLRRLTDPPKPRSDRKKKAPKKASKKTGKKAAKKASKTR